MVHVVEVSHSRDGYSLRIAEVPLRVLVVERILGSVCLRALDLAASRWGSWLWRVGAGRRSIGSVLDGIGNWPLIYRSRRERDVTRIPLTVEDVAAKFPDARMAFLEK